MSGAEKEDIKMPTYIVTYTTNGFDCFTTEVKAKTYTMALLEFAVRFPRHYQLIEAVPKESPEGIELIPARV